MALAVTVVACGGDDGPAAPDAMVCQPVDDGRECTSDLCRDGQPVHDLVAPGTPCAAGTCDTAGSCLPPSCTDQVLNGDETDVDCGGGCSPCADGDTCAHPGDCASGVCTDLVCQPGRCGDGVTQASEDCDDGNHTNGDGCDDGAGGGCRITGCGNGVITAPETCDDGNGIDGDGCDHNCTVSACGNGVTAGTETCDDGNVMDADGCSATCTTEPGYTCSMAVPAVCRTTCGDGVKAGAEECDDHNAVSIDGCSSACRVELGYACVGTPSVCTSTCGDGIPASDEGCDDFPPAEDGDGCSATCTVEPGYECSGLPSFCQPLPPPSIAGFVRNLDDSGIVDATITFLERPGLTTTTGAGGAFSIMVPTETPLTMRITAATQVPTIEQTVIVHASVTGQTFRMARPDQYAFIGSFGADAPAPRGHFRMDLVGMPLCNFVGGHLGLEPESGTVIYAQSNQLPNATYTALQPNAPGGYVVAARGTVTPFVRDLPAPCAQLPFPVELGNVTVLGPIIVEDGAFHDISIFVH
ncbi:MAG TPA: DUF4215 domain-containing protein [Kofleriaceae bacterium]|nr:DUF4215 domain-containing protein [Kofleriaceae bacterium]